ncbi:MAG: veratrol--corrinoid protein metyltransferase [Oscillospiraceae bacterium]|jgi:hypothetical protein|nr:veratrol--corrinoid protein metyltransferase [Oscillospiraceae bacterium]
MTYRLSERDNYLRCLNGEIPEYIPRYDIARWTVIPEFMTAGRRIPGLDPYGVEYVATAETNGATLPKPNDFILSDIRKWRDVIKNPDISHIDWEQLAKKDLAGRDRAATPLFADVSAGCFQRLVTFMGFTEGLCALAEEPEECYALFDYLSEFSLEVERKLIRYYKPDGIVVADDNATGINPFISLPMYRELFVPFLKRHTELALENNLYLHMHDCGRCEDFIQDWLELGFRAWDTAQVSNNLLKIKETYGRKLILCGCWDSSGPASWLSSPDDLLRDELKRYVDTYAPNGGFSYVAYVMGTPGDPVYDRKQRIVDEFYRDYAMGWYDK